MAQLLLRNALLFDGLSEEPQDGTDVLIDGNRIVEISPTPIRSTAARSLDLKGRFLMPGLIDAHFHAVLVDANLARLGHMPRSLNTLHAARNLEAALKRGFTTLRDAGGADHGLVKAIEAGLSRRFLPNEIIAVPEIPRTLSGKKQELPIKKLLLGHPVEKVINKDAMANPACLDWYLAFARTYLARSADQR